MGGRMATNLASKGTRLKVFDVVPAACKNVPNADVCSSPQEVAENSNVVITMLPHGKAVKEAILGEHGVLKKLTDNSILVDCSTVEPQLAQELHDVANRYGVRFVDAPVSGGVTGAEAGTLTFMAGGEETDISAVRHLLLQMGTTVLHCGKSGAGQTAKLCNNLILAASMTATAEAMNLGIKLGLDAKVLASVINRSSGRCWSSDTYNPVPDVGTGLPCSNDYNGGFSCNLMAKDLGLAENAALSVGASVPLGAMAHQLYRLLIANGYGIKDFSVVYKFLQGETKDKK